MRILVTGSAGFIGSALALRLLERGDEVIGIDNLNDYYDAGLKRARLARNETHPGFTQHTIALEDRAALEAVFRTHRPQRVVNLAGQAGVRHSIDNPHAYADSNVVGFVNILEACRHQDEVEHLVYASSSSVYGASATLPLHEDQRVDHPVSLYAASKKANELMAHSYSHLYGLPTSGLRLFTVYGPWMRPDMALYKFTRAILDGRPIDVYNHGNHRRDFTFIDDIVEAVLRVVDTPPTPAAERPDGATDPALYRIYNVGNGTPVELMRCIRTLEQTLGKRAQLNMLPAQPGDVPETCADVTALARATGFTPATDIETGVERFVAWYRDYHRR